jgi:hypothetical protein
MRHQRIMRNRNPGVDALLNVNFQEYGAQTRITNKSIMDYWVSILPVILLTVWKGTSEYRARQDRSKRPRENLGIRILPVDMYRKLQGFLVSPLLLPPLPIVAAPADVEEEEEDDGEDI